MGVGDGSGVYFDHPVGTIPGAQADGIGQSNRFPLAQRENYRTLDRFAAARVDEAKYLVHKLSLHLLQQPAGEGLSHRVEIADAALDVRRDHTVADTR